MSKRSESKGANIQSERRENLRNELWGEDTIKTLPLWIKEKHKGFATIPRALPQISRIMDKLAGKGKPVSGVYLSLWCNIMDSKLNFIEIKDRMRFAFESGFTGERAVTTWTNRMRILKEQGFIDAKKGVQGEFHYVLVINPFEVIKQIYKTKEKDEFYNALIGRMDEVGTNFDKETKK